MFEIFFLDKKKSENVLEVEDEIDLVQPTPPRSTVRENRKKEKQITTSTFVDDEGFICKFIYRITTMKYLINDIF
jgi:hypothetical protein